MAHCEIGIVATWAVGSILSYSVVVDASRVKETVGSLPGVLPDFGGDVL